MDNDGTTNSQITDSVTQSNTTVLGQAPAGSQGLLDVAMAETIGIGMYNAVTAQHHSQMVNGAAVAATCARLLQPARQGGPPAPPKPAPPISPLAPAQPPAADPGKRIQQAQAAENELLTQLDTAVRGNEQLLDKVKSMFEKVTGGGSGEDASNKPSSDTGG